MSAVVAEMNVAHAAHLKPSDLSSPALAGADSSLLPDTALAAASLLQAPPASDPSTSDATAAGERQAPSASLHGNYHQVHKHTSSWKVECAVRSLSAYMVSLTGHKDYSADACFSRLLQWLHTCCFTICSTRT